MNRALGRLKVKVYLLVLYDQRPNVHQFYKKNSHIKFAISFFLTLTQQSKSEPSQARSQPYASTHVRTHCEGE